MPHRPLPTLLTALLAAAPAAVPAAELIVRDIRGAVLVRAGDFDFELDSDTFDRSGSDSFESGTGLELGARYSWSAAGSSWGLVLGGDITADWYTYDEDQGLAMYGARGALGGGWSPFDRWTFVLEAGVGAAVSELEIPETSGAAEFTADGTALFYDARLSCLYRVAQRWSVHAHVGYMQADHDLSGSGVDVTLDQSGVWAGLGVTWMFSGKPPRLE